MTTFAKPLAQTRHNEIALRDERVALTWADVDDTLNRVANALLSENLGESRRIAVYAENGVETAFS